MSMVSASFQCDRSAWRAFRDQCARSGRNASDLLSGFVAGQLAARTTAVGSVSRDAMRRTITAAVDRSLGWGDLMEVLDAAGLAYHPTWLGLVVIDVATGEVLAKASDVGPGYGELVRRFRQGFPGHPNPDLVRL